jgi:uncharacterized Zn finger protein
MSEPETEEPTPAVGRLGAATLFCEHCGRATAHRILRVRPDSAPGAMRGIARCRECRFTHPFESVPPALAELRLIVSDGPKSESEVIRLPRLQRLGVDEELPRAATPVRIRRLEDHGGASVSSARAFELSAVWASRDEGAVVPVSIAEGARTFAARIRLPHGTRLAVGEQVVVESEPVEVVGLRANGRTWRRIGDAFPADEVDRVYGRRTAIPPAGRRAWSRERESPSSRARSVSIAARSRSSPGTRTTRSRPRARIADGGAAVQRVRPA